MHRRHVLMAVPLIVAFAACGGGSDDAAWDEFQPRAATVDDLADDTFVFHGFQYGAVFDPVLAGSTTILSLGSAEATEEGHRMPQSISANGGSASGVAVLAGSRLTLTFSQTSPWLPFEAETPLQLEVEADVDDGRIRLSNPATHVQQASAPR